jgi:uncharacterized protein YxeA
MAKSIIIGLVALVVIVGGGVLIFHKSPKTTSTASTSTSKPAPATTSPKSTTSTTSTSSPSATPSASASSSMNVTITANDGSASPDTITASKGQTVNIKFAVSSNGTYHGGLDFKSTDPAIDSGSIAEGASKTVSFTATKSFKFTPYWYESDVQKDYFVTVNVN